MRVRTRVLAFCLSVVCMIAIVCAQSLAQVLFVSRGLLWLLFGSAWVLCSLLLLKEESRYLTEVVRSDRRIFK